MEHEQVKVQVPTDDERRFAAKQLAVKLGHGRLVGAALSAAVVLFALSFKWGAGAAFLVGLLTASGSGLIDGRISVAAGILCVACCPLGLIAQAGAWLQQSPLVNYYAASVGLYDFQNVSNTLVTWAFYLLSIGLMGRIVQYVVARTKGDDLQAEVT